MLKTLSDLEFDHILRPVYEVQVCYLLIKYGIEFTRYQEFDFASKVKIAANNIIYKEALVQGSNAWQYFHDLEIEADEYLEWWEKERRVIDELECVDEERFGGPEMGMGDEVVVRARRKAHVDGKARERQDGLRRRVVESQKTFYMTYEVSRSFRNCQILE